MDMQSPAVTAITDGAKRVTGTVKFFGDVKGFGFIVPDDGGPEVFMHRTDFGRNVFELKPGQRVSYYLVDSGNAKGNGKKATDIRPVSR